MVEAMDPLFPVKNFLLVCRIDNEFDSLSVEIQILQNSSPLLGGQT